MVPSSTLMNTAGQFRRPAPLLRAHRVTGPTPRVVGTPAKPLNRGPLEARCARVAVAADRALQSRMDRRPPESDPVCPLCSKPVRSGTLVHYQHGEFFHLWCRTRQSQQRTLEEVDRAQAAKARARELIDAAARAQAAARRFRGPNASCPLCGHSAQYRRLRPGEDWLFLIGCGCDGYFVRKVLIETHVLSLVHAERQELARHIREYRSMGYEVCCTTADRTGTGPVILRIM
jgi:hypothetical protein